MHEVFQTSSFQFQTGAIKSQLQSPYCVTIDGFNSKLVRLKVQRTTTQL